MKRSGARWGFAMLSMRIPVHAILVVLALAQGNAGFARAESPQCSAPPDVPSASASQWCIAAQREGAGFAYTTISYDLRGVGRSCEALTMAERGAELKHGTAYLVIGNIKVFAECGQRDVPAAIAAFEAAVRRREALAGLQLRQVYEGRFGREYRDPAKAIMWAYTYYLIHAQPDDKHERNFGRRSLGLSEARIDEGRERMRRWLAENKVEIRQRW